MSSQKNVAGKLLDFFDVTVTSISFLVIFVTFVIAIVSRYFLRVAVTWSYEISILGYMWTMFFGVGRALRNDEHVVFSLVYDKLGWHGKRRSLILYNILLAAMGILIFVPGVRAMLASNSRTGVLKLPYKVVFSPFFFMLAEIIAVSAVNVKKAWRMKGDAEATAEQGEVKT